MFGLSVEEYYGGSNYHAISFMSCHDVTSTDPACVDVYPILHQTSKDMGRDDRKGTTSSAKFMPSFVQYSLNESRF